MRKLVWTMIPVAALAACGGEAGEKAKGKADALQPGQYEITGEVTNFRAADEGAPKVEAKAGDRIARSVCVTDGAALPPDLFADDGFTCRSAVPIFARGGTLNANLQCDRAGLSGASGYSVTGTFTADSFEAQRQFSTRLTTDGDVVIASTIRGRRTGDCTAAPAGNAAAANTAGAAK